MSKLEAEQFEEAVQRAAQGQAIDAQWQPLVLAAQQVATLAEPPLPPPHRLALGRQRFLAEAAQLRVGGTPKPRRWVPIPGVMRLSTVLMAAVLAFGLIFAAGQVVAGSLPGEPLYGLDLAIEKLHLTLTTDPLARADLDRALAEERLDEMVLLLEQGRLLDGVTLARVGQQLAQALEAAVWLEDPAAAQALQRLEAAVQYRQQIVAAVAEGLPGPEQAPVRQVLREMERVRQEAHAGQVDPAGLRQRHDMPPDPTSQPGPSRTPQQRGPGAINRPGTGPDPSSTRGPAGPEPTTQRQPTRTQPPGVTGEPVEPRPTEPSDTGQGPGPYPTGRPRGLSPTAQQDPGPSPQPTPGPGRSSATGQPALGPQPTDGSGGPTPVQPPGPGPQDTGEPGAPGPTGEPGGDPRSGSSPTGEPGSGDGSGGRGKP